jgi:mycothiol synthase
VTTSIGTRELPRGLTHRRPTVADAERILPLVVACDLKVVGRSDSTLSQLSADLAAPGVDNERGGRLVEAADGAVVGWLWTEAFEPASEVFVDSYALEAPLLEWLFVRANEYVLEVVREWGRPVTMVAGCYAHDEEYGEILRAGGLEVVRSFWNMRMTLDTGALAEHPLPAGVEVRLVDATDETDLRLMHRLHDESFADHWKFTPLPHDDWYDRFARSAGCDVTQWWVAEVDGEPAGLLVGAENRAENNEGYVDTLGVLREFRGRGVAKTLLRVAFAESARRGRSRIGLQVDSESPTGATRLYEAVGMSVDNVMLAWERTVSP